MSHPHDARETLHGTHILIVDDEFLIAADIQCLFGDAGASVALATTLPAALDAARREQWSLALLDIRLGSESSEGVADVLAQRGIPFLFFSGQSMPDGMRAKFPHAPLLFKPMGFDVLLDAAADLMRQRAA